MNDHTRSGPSPAGGSQSKDEADVAELLQRAGSRPATTDAELAELRRLAHAPWRRAVERRRFRRRAVWGVAAAAALLFLAANLGRRLPAPDPAATPLTVATVERLLGDVRGADGLALTPGVELPGGSRLVVASGGAALRLAAGGSLRLDAGSRVELSSGARVHLEAGAVYFDSGPGSAPVTVVTALGNVTDVGTQFEVRLNHAGDALRVRVREGEIELDTGEAKFRAPAGVQLALDAAGALSRSPVAAAGAEWAWTASLAPSFELDGSRLGDLVAWFERESGRRVRLDPALGDDLFDLRLYGSAAGLSPEEVLAVALAGSDLAARSDGEDLVLVTAPR